MNPSSALSHLSIRTRFQTVVVLLAVAAIGATGWIASLGATAALREATYDRLTAIRETRKHALERYVEDLGKHVVALSTSESTTAALVAFQEGWHRIGRLTGGSAEHLALQRFYRESLLPLMAPRLDWDDLRSTWFPRDDRVQMLQYHAIVANPHPLAAKDLLLDIGPALSAYSAAHAAHHPTLHRYRRAFGFYDLFLISAPDGRVLYTARKEIDLGADLLAEPYRSTALGRAFRRVVDHPASYPAEGFVIEDYDRYVASAFVPAAFVAAPVRLAGATLGVLAMQLSIEEVDRVMTGARSWREAGFGQTGHAYVVGPDATPRSDFRGLIEDRQGFVQRLEASGVAADALERIRHDGTTVLNLPLNLWVSEPVASGAGGTTFGVNLFGDRVLRSRTAVSLPDLQWTLVAEVDADEALAPVRALQTRIDKWPSMVPAAVERAKADALEARRAARESRLLAERHLRLAVEALG